MNFDIIQILSCKSESSEASNMGVIQPKLTVGSTNDPQEQQADQTADNILRMPESPFVQRKCAACEHEEEQISRKIEPFIQKKGNGLEGGTASESVTNQINSSQGGGNKMSENSLSFMESRFNTDFSGVKIHTNSDAIQMSRELNAQAFTVGNDIYFNEGKYSPESTSGKHLLAHELTHTVQQSGGIDRMIQRRENDDLDYSGTNSRVSPQAYLLIKQRLMREKISDLESKILNSLTFRKLNYSDKRLTKEIISKIHTKSDTFALMTSLETLFVTIEKKPETISAETKADTVTAESNEKTRLSKPEEAKNVMMEEDASSQKIRHWEPIKGQFGKGTYFVDRTDPKNIVVKAKVFLKPTGTGNAHDVASIKAMEDGIEKAASMKGFIVDVIFVNTPDAETFTAEVNPSRWEDATNWSGGSPTGFAHELIHMFAYKIDRYNYIDSHASNTSMEISKRLHWFSVQLDKPDNWDNDDSIMGSGEHPLDDDVCRIAGLDMKSCLAARLSP